MELSSHIHAPAVSLTGQVAGKAHTYGRDSGKKNCLPLPISGSRLPNPTSFTLRTVRNFVYIQQSNARNVFSSYMQQVKNESHYRPGQALRISDFKTISTLRWLGQPYAPPAFTT